VYTILGQEMRMAGQVVKVGVREFREGLAQFLDSPTPIAVTRHGQTVGYYIPARGPLDEEELLALRRAVDRLEALLTEHGISADEVVGELRSRRVSG
jgi:hypothetical protein